jgi:hypothetical protein
LFKLRLFVWPAALGFEHVGPAALVGFDEVLAEDFATVFVGDNDVGLIGVEDHGYVAVPAFGSEVLLQ